MDGFASFLPKRPESEVANGELNIRDNLQWRDVLAPVALIVSSNSANGGGHTRIFLSPVHF